MVRNVLGLNGLRDSRLVALLSTARLGPKRMVSNSSVHS